MNTSIQTTKTESLQTSRALARYLERLQHERRPHRPRWMTPDQARIYQMAALFRAAVPGAAEPNPLFATRLQEQMEGVLRNRQCRDKE